ncbi:MAG: HAD hydrolase-like protein [Phycisphaerae bacterium]|nr:HAD hydrolase-like protein [Phycisphaerae bacterium]
MLDRTPPTAAALIFDLDGTLVDTLDDLTSALNGALSAHGCAAVSSARVRRWVGDGAAALCRSAAPDADDARRASLLSAFLQAYREGCLNATTLYPGMPDVLNRLHRAGIPMAVLSNKPHEFTLRVVAALCHPEWFAVVRGVMDESERKPSPSLALHVAGTLDRSPSKIFLIGDSPGDIATAHASGMKSVAVTWGFRDRDVLQDARPNWIVDRPEQLLEIPELGASMWRD